MNVLDEVEHRRIIEDMEHVCSVSGVPEHMIRQSSKLFLTANEIHWLKEILPDQMESGPFGALLSGKMDYPPQIKFQAMTGALLRHFIDARVVTISGILSSIEKSDPKDPTVMFVPNFYTVSDGKPFTSWQLQLLYDFLMQRGNQGRMTVLYVESMKMMKTHYGSGIPSLIETYKNIGE